jgi:hypothetical protein
MSNFTQLSEGDGTIFLVRWRGRQEGPYAGPVIAAKLAANEIGLLHEIYYESKWITIRDYIALRETALVAETQARQNAGQKLREEGELLAKEREGRQRAEMLAEERRKTDLLAAEIVRQSDTVEARVARQPTKKPLRAGIILAVFFIVLIMVAVIFLFHK